MSDILNLFKKDETPKRISICQDSKILEQINTFNYNLKDIGFVKYFQDRTGIIITSTLSLLFAEKEPQNKIILNLKRRLQDCWEIYNQ